MSIKNNSMDFSKKSLKEAINKYKIDDLASIDSKYTSPKKRRTNHRKKYFDDSSSDNESNSKQEINSTTKIKKKSKKNMINDSENDSIHKESTYPDDSENDSIHEESTYSDDTELSYDLDDISFRMGRVEKQTHTLIKIWQERYLWIKQNKMFYTKTNNDDLKFIKPIAIESITNISINTYGRVFKIDTAFAKSYSFTPLHI